MRGIITASVSEINADIYLNGTRYSTPFFRNYATEIDAAGGAVNVQAICEQTKTVSGTIYEFSHAIINATYEYTNTF